MGEWLRDQFNCWVGSNITFVCNAYDKAEFVWLLFHTDVLSINNISLRGNPGNCEVNIGREKVTEKVRVPHGDFHKKERNTSFEYITVLAKIRNGNNVIICENYGIGANKSFIITRDGAIKPQKYHDSNRWKDEWGYNHKP